jgi:alpha-tubulin suppressor-like RCC1 family protein
VADDQIVVNNPAQDLRGTFVVNSLVLVGAGGELELRLAAWGRAGSAMPAGDARPVERGCVESGAVGALGDCVRAVAYRRPGVTEWWEDRPEGLEHGFTVPVPPSGDGALVFELTITGAVASVDGDVATLVRPSGRRLRYAGLAAWDATGQVLPAWMEATAGGLRLLVDDHRAVGAVTVDPVLSAPVAWTAEGDQPSEWLGYSVASAGDVNGDGYDDAVVGAVYYTHGQTYEGGAFLYLGSAAGLTSTAAWTGECDRTGADFADSVSPAGDVNADGYDDVVVGAPEYDDGLSARGRAYLYLGSAAGLSATADWTAVSDLYWSRFGGPVASAGDVDGDGYDDVVVGSDEGATVYLGSAAGLSSTAAWTAQPDQIGAYFGASVASAGDVNGDGYDDVVVGAYQQDDGETDEGRAYLYLGSAAGLSATAAWTAEGDQASAYFGQAVASAGDVNGDGYDDVVIGAWSHDNGQTDEGRAYVYLGSPAGLSVTASWTAESDQANAGFAHSVASAGDVNRDGYDDVVVGAFLYDYLKFDVGQASVYLGSAAGLSATAAWTGRVDQQAAGFGYSVASAGDVDANGYDDVLVGAIWYDNGVSVDEGRAFLYLGVPPDADGDGSEDTLDCADADPMIHPEATEIIGDGVDQDCDGVDACYQDLDGDGYGTAVVVDGASLECVAAGESVTPVDCDDASAAVHPDAAEIPGDGVDQDCDGADGVSPIDPPAGTDGGRPLSNGNGGCGAVPQPGVGWLVTLAAALFARRRSSLGQTRAAPSALLKSLACLAMVSCGKGRDDAGSASGGSDTDAPTTEACSAGTWDHDADATTACMAWTDCADDQYVTADGSATQDRVCTPCPTGRSSTGPNAVECALDVLYVQLSAGSAHTCALRSDGHAVCWGSNLFGEIGGAPPGVAFAQVSAGEHTCGIRSSDGEAVCWGDDANGEVSETPAAVPFSGIAAGWIHTCAIQAADGRVVCWGADAYDLLNAPVGVSFEHISAGSLQTCGIRSVDRGVECWGSDAVGAVSGAPSGVAFEKLSSGALHLCGIRSDDSTVACWGYDLDDAGAQGGQVSEVPAGVAFQEIAAGGYHTCGIRSGDGQVECWGSDAYHQVSGAPVGERFEQLSAGSAHTCGVRASDGMIVCWGADFTGQVSGAPNEVPFAEVSNGGGHTCAIRTSDGEPVCWGSDSMAQVSGAPSGVALDHVAAGRSHTCAIRSNDNAVDCWGSDLYGEVSGAPVGIAFQEVSAGGEYACGLRSPDGQVTCWGRDTDGQVSGAPVSVPFARISAGTSHACALRASDGAILCWGSDIDGAVSGVPSGIAFEQVSAGDRHTCGIRSDDGGVACWGYDVNGQVSLVPPGVAFDEVSAGSATTCGVRTADGEIVCWGSYRQSDVTGVPVGTAFTRVSARNGLTCGVRRDDQTLTCWDNILWNPR